MNKNMAKQNKNRKFTFNIIDVLIILLLIAVIALIVYVFILGKDLGDLFTHDVENTQNSDVIKTAENENTAISVPELEFNENIGEVFRQA